MNHLHPGARWLFRLTAYSIFFPLILFFFILYIIIMFGGTGEYLVPYNLIYLIVVIIIIGELYARMSYNRWFYEVGPESVRIEHGIIWKKYTSIPYERIQNVDIKRGIIARFFGFSTLEIETAGQSWTRSHQGYEVRIAGWRVNHYKSEGHLPAIDLDDAEKIRKFVITKIKKAHKNSQGL